MNEELLNSSDIKVHVPHIPAQMAEQVSKCCEELVLCHKDHILSVNVIGSALSPEFMLGQSDINLIVIYNDLEFDYLQIISSGLITRFKKFKINTRIISKRNLMSSAPYFPIDFWSMQQQHMLLYGEDVLLEPEITHKDLLWQLNHEAKGMRMRIKQQLWQSSKNIGQARKTVLRYFNSVILLSKVFMHLKNYPIPSSTPALFDEINKLLFVDANSLETLNQIKQGNLKLTKGNMYNAYEILFKIIKKIDDQAGSIKC
ncbi:MAG: hypothetical protein K8S27_00805 [Candidatus Omnitrophica bacterium]|nr:hypothetical protein [Candidatus Omnitrophota bacterium]